MSHQCSRHFKRRFQSLVVVASVTVILCGTACTHPKPDLRAHVQYADGPDFPKPTSELDDPSTDGFDFCRKVARSARHRSIADSGFGWTFAVLGVGATTAGAIIPIAKADPLDWKDKVLTSSLTLGGVFLMEVARAYFKRSDAAGKLAATTTQVLGTETEDARTKAKVQIRAAEAGAQCNAALAGWESSRSDASAVATALLEKQKADDAKKAAGESIKRLDVLEQALKQCGSNCDSPDKVQQMTDAVRNF